MNRQLRALQHQKERGALFVKSPPSKTEGSNGDTRYVKISNTTLRLYRKELGIWWYIEFTRS